MHLYMNKLIKLSHQTKLSIALIALMLRRCDPCQLAEALSRAASSGEQPSLFRWQGHEVRGSRPALPKPSFCTPRLPADTA